MVDYMDDISMLLYNINIGNADPILLFLPHWPQQAQQAQPGWAGCGFYVFF